MGGVLEHPEASSAWKAYGLCPPPRSGGWVLADYGQVLDENRKTLWGWQGWTCCVEQGAYGHAARKATWLYAANVSLPSLRWGHSPGDFLRLDEGHHSKEERARIVKTGICRRLSARQRLATPLEFRDLLISIAQTARRP